MMTSPSSTTSKSSGGRKKNKKSSSKKRKTPSPDTDQKLLATTATPTTTHVHRCRFLHGAADAEHGIAFNHAVQALAFNASGSSLAVARSNGNIELWNMQHGSFVERVRSHPDCRAMFVVFCVFCYCCCLFVARHV
jgi:WD40 repeat protein